MWTLAIVLVQKPPDCCAWRVGRVRPWKDTDGKWYSAWSTDGCNGTNQWGPTPASESSNLDYLQQRLASAMTTGAVALTKLWS